MPVVSMSIRPLIGMVQALERPGSFSASFIWLTSSAVEMVSGVIRRKIGLSQSGAQEEYQVSTFRHSLFGLRVIRVSSIERGAGSVDVSARPAFPSTWSTSGKRLMIRSVDLEKLLRLRDGDPRHGGGHIEERTFIQRRHELGAELLKDGDRHQHQDDGGADDAHFQRSDHATAGS